MRCFSRKQLESYALETARTGKAQAENLAAYKSMEQHLHSCGSCRDKVEQMRMEQRELEKLLYGEALDPLFTAGVMEAISAEETGEQNAGMTPLEKESRRKRWKKRMIVGAAALLLVGGGSGYLLERSALQGPTPEAASKDREASAERIGRLLHDPAGKWEWTQRTIAYDRAGLAQYPQIELRDKKTGYRMEVIALLSDGLTATVIIRISDREGNPVNATISPASFAWRNEAGESAADYNFDGSGESGTLAFTYALNPNVTGKVRMFGDVFGFTFFDTEEKTVQFDKALSFEQTLELKSARENTMTMLPSDMFFNLQGGFRMELLRVSRTPVQLQIATRLSVPESVGNSGGDSDWMTGRSLNFHIEDEQGNVLERFGEKLTYPLAGSMQDFHTGSEGEPVSAAAWNYPLRKPIELEQPLKLVFDSVSLPVNAAEEVSFRPSAVSPEHPVELTADGGRFLFTGAEIRQVEGISVLELPYTAELTNEDVGTWKAEDGSGISYPSIDPLAEGGTRMRIFGVKKMPADLTLRRTAFVKTYDHLGISVRVPTAKQPPTLTSEK